MVLLMVVFLGPLCCVSILAEQRESLCCKKNFCKKSFLVSVTLLFKKKSQVKAMALEL